MNEERLQEMLQGADALAGPPRTLPADLPERVRRADRRRKRNTAIGSAVAAALALSVTAGWWLRAGDSTGGSPVTPVVADATSAPTTASPTEGGRAEPVRHSIPADPAIAAAERALEIVRERRQLAEWRQLSAVPDPVVELRREVDRAAMLALTHAERVCRAPAGTPNCAAELRRVVELFPGSQWAALAQANLDGM